MTTAPRDLVSEFWRVMGTNDFQAASLLLSPDFRGVWPQSGEVIEGRANFAALNTAYPAKGPWRFTLNRCVAGRDQVVTDVTVTDGETVATVISFHTVRGGHIVKQVEYWPDPYDPPSWRAHWVAQMEDPSDEP
ncbi:nuclear transport factor 2 family protein [Aestuariivita sp.]|jgi:ketosteroid isomerase-like protein|uniref:nuclear transport factor 2 family protein n=1 Tax=Aestuariivita sp. TaxID=1872407 RepID=UPI00217323BF|nr:nuclear transport factor 2 family protein [Aestuariivita sp.]MCE8008889.1 nuclear transport factor 2 family protein [Aestuariivita sp.]